MSNLRLALTSVLKPLMPLAEKLVNGTKSLTHKATLEPRLMEAKVEVLRLESELAKREQRSDVFLAANGQRVEPRDVTELRDRLQAKRQVVAGLQQEFDARGPGLLETKQKLRDQMFR